MNLEGLTGMPRDLYHVPFFYGFLLLAAAVLTTAWFIRRSKFGMALEAIREDEDKAQAVGINTNLYTLIAFTISVGFTGVIGGLYAWWTAFIEPVFVFDIVVGVNMILMCLLGGMRTLWGPVLGAVLLVPASDYIVATLGAAQLYLFGVGTLLAVLCSPCRRASSRRSAVSWSGWARRRRRSASRPASSSCPAGTDRRDLLRDVGPAQDLRRRGRCRRR